jgi:hypothetical protein
MFNYVKFVTTKKGMTTNFFFTLSFAAVFGSGIRDKHPGSATLLRTRSATYLKCLIIKPNIRIFPNILYGTFC